MDIIVSNKLKFGSLVDNENLESKKIDVDDENQIEEETDINFQTDLMLNHFTSNGSNKEYMDETYHEKSLSDYSKNANFYEVDGGEKIEQISSKIEQILSV